MTRARTSLVPLSFLVGLLAACGGSDADGSVDAASDADVQGGGDTDSGGDAGTDALSDAAVDAADSDVDSDPGVDADAAEVTPDSEEPDVTPPPTCTPPAPGTIQAEGLGGWTVELNTGDGSWAVRRAGTEAAILTGPAICGDGVTWGVSAGTGTPAVNNAFGAFQITDRGPGSGVTEAIPTGEVQAPVRDGDVVRWTFPLSDGTSVSLVFELAEGGSGDLRIGLERGDEVRGPMSFAFACREDEAFFGLGTQVTGMDLRGGRYPLWTQEQGIGKPPGGGGFPFNNIPEAAYAPMGIWHSSAGYTAIVDHDAYSALDLCVRDGVGSLRSFPDAPAMVLVSGDAPADRMQSIRRYLGTPPRPTPWTFGVWNDAVGGSARVREVAQLLRENDIPSSAMWSEDWIGGQVTETGFRLSYAWEWSEAQYPDLPTLIQELHSGGFAFLGYFNTFVPTTTRMYTEGVEGGFLVRSPEGDRPYPLLDAAFRDTALVDLTNEAAVAWMGSYMRIAAEDLGLDGWMADFTEWMPVDATLASGEEGWRYHNRWPLDFQRLNTAVLSEVHPEGANDAGSWTYFPRSGWASTSGGTGGIAPVMWGGDQNTDWDADDGIPSVIPIATHVGLAGVGVFGSDIAGYSSFANPNTTKELFFRWTTLGAFHPLMRTHHGSDKCDNWAFDRDPESLAHFGRWARVHVALYPFFAQLTDEWVSTAMPVTRHPWLVEPTRPGMWDDDAYQFFLGSNLLVSPVVEPGALTQTVVLPDDSIWYPLFGTEPVTGAVAAAGGVSTLEVPAAVSEIPVFVRGGTALLLLPPGVDTFYPGADDAQTSLADVAGQFRVALYPDSSGVSAGSALGLAVTVDGIATEAEWNAWVESVAPEACTPSSSTACRSVTEDGGIALQIAVSPGPLSVGSPDGETRFDVESEASATLIVRFGGTAFVAEEAAAPATIDLESTAPSWCAVE